MVADIKAACVEITGCCFVVLGAYIWSVFVLLSCYSGFTVGLLLLYLCSLNKLNISDHLRNASIF